ncbi:protein abrupt [Anabrus simplex]|uniref:protein abrupt n=1 Tax=Anabrus simplex TaxID=316456 RepID=UPI0035A3ACCC
MGSDQQFCLRWHNYQSSLLASLPQLLDSDDLTDVTLSAGGHNLKAHRVVLSACSQYFKELFKLLHPTQHPVIVLPGTNFTDLCALVTFMYSGEVNIYQEQLQGLLTMADAMQIRGLAEVNGTAASEVANRDSSCSAVKRPKLSVPTTSSMLLNQMQTENGKCISKPFQSEVVDMAVNSMKAKNSDFELFGNGNRATTNCRKSAFENDSVYKSTSREEVVKPKSVTENMEPFIGVSKSNRCNKVVPQLETELMHYMEDMVNTSPKPDLGTDETKVKCEPEVSLSCSSAEGSVNHSLPITENEVVPDQRSTSSDDSGGGGGGGSTCNSFGIEASGDRIQLNQGVTLTATRGYSSLPPSRQSVTCPICRRVISQKRNLNMHLRTHQISANNKIPSPSTDFVSFSPRDNDQALNQSAYFDSFSSSP